MDLKAARENDKARLARLVEQSTSQAGTSGGDQDPASEYASQTELPAVDRRTLDSLVLLLGRIAHDMDRFIDSPGMNEVRRKTAILQYRLVNLQHCLSMPLMNHNRVAFEYMNHKHGVLVRVQRAMQRLDNELQRVVGRVVEFRIPQGLNLRFDLVEPMSHLISQATFCTNGHTRALKQAIRWDLLLHAITDQSDNELFQMLAQLTEARKRSLGDAQLLTDHLDSCEITFQDAYSLVLAALMYGRENALHHLLDLRPYSEGPAFLLRALKDDEFVVRKLIDDHIESVSQGDHFWLLELRASGHSTEEIVKLLRKAVDPGPWLLDAIHGLPLVDWKLDIDLHQGCCVHNGASISTTLRESAVATDSVDWSQNSSSRCNMRRNVFGYCGLAGVIPNSEHAMSDVAFDSQSASVLFPCGWSWSPMAVDFAQRWTNDRLTDSEVDLVMKLESATTRFCQAAAILQQSKFCCNSFTVFIRRPRRTTSKPVMDLVSFSFRTLNEYSEALSALLKENKSSNMDDCLGRCVHISEKLLNVFAVPGAVDRAQLGQRDLHSRLNYKLHLCALAVQLLGFGLAAYSQAHIGPLAPEFLSHPIHELYLRGSLPHDLHLVARLQELTCLGEMIGGPVLVIELYPKGSSYIVIPSWTASDFRGCGVDIIDTWGPGTLISKRESAYGQQVYAIELAGGVIVPSGARIANVNEGVPSFHWYPHHRRYDTEAPTFNIYNGIVIGSISINRHCPIEASQFCENSSSRRFYIGTWPDYWELTQRQVALQTGSYAILQVGNVYGRKFGMTLKRLIIEQWSLSSDFGILDLPWGLQVSSCTGIAKRVPLHTLVEHLIFSDVHGNWHGGSLKAEQRLRQQWRAKIPSHFGDWAGGLSTQDRADLATSIDFLLRVLEHTGLNHKNQTLSMFALGSSKLSHGIAFSYNTTPPSNRWAHMLRDSESCATFAAMTPLCLVTDHHKCQSLEKHDRFQGFNGGPCLSTVLSHYLPATSPTNASKRTPWQLEPGRKYWIGKVGSEVTVDAVSKGHNRETQLVLKTRYYPGIIARRLGYEVLREKQEAECEGEEVLIFDERASTE